MAATMDKLTERLRLSQLVAALEKIAGAMQDSMGAQRLPGSGTFAFRRMTDPLQLEVGLEPTRFDVPPGFFDEGGPAGTPKRVERYTATTNASGVATFTFSPSFTAPPDIEVITGWSGDQMVSGGVTAQTLNGCTVLVKVSRGTLALSTGPFQTAGSGVSVTIRAIGN